MVSQGRCHSWRNHVRESGGGQYVLDLERRTHWRFRTSSLCALQCNEQPGIQYRSKHITEGKVRNDWVVRGYQHEIRNQNELPSVSGFIYDEGGRRGRMCLVGDCATWEVKEKKQVLKNLIDAAAFKKLFHLDDWNDVIISCKGNHIKHYLNGRLILDCTDNGPDLALSDGVLAIQLHTGKPMWVEFKNVRIKELR